MHRILLTAAALAATAFLAGSPAQAAMGGDTGDASVTIRYGDNGHYGDDNWRRWHRGHAMDRGWGYRHRPYYGSFHHDRCRIRIVTREREGRTVTIRRQVCF